MKQTMKKRQTKQMPAALEYISRSGIGVIPTYENTKHTLHSWKDETNFLYDYESVRNYWDKGFSWFQLHPQTMFLIVIDLDIKDGKDGLKAMHEVFQRYLKGSFLPAYLIDVDKHPCYVRTPSGGYHLYFYHSRYDKKFKSEDVSKRLINNPGFEIIHYKHLITAPGSVREKGEYRLIGNLDDAPHFPTVLYPLLTEYGVYKPKQNHRQLYTANTLGYRNNRLAGNKPLSLDDITRIIDRNGEYSPGTSRNGYCYAVANFARKKGFDSINVQSYLASKFEAEDFKIGEIKDVIKSAFK
jgi:hypothetical protein